MDNVLMVVSWGVIGSTLGTISALTQLERLTKFDVAALPLIGAASSLAACFLGLAIGIIRVSSPEGLLLAAIGAAAMISVWFWAIPERQKK